MIHPVDDDWCQPYLDKLCETVNALDQQSFFSDAKILLEKQRQEWPEIWLLIDTLATMKMLQNKFPEE